MWSMGQTLVFLGLNDTSTQHIFGGPQCMNHWGSAHYKSLLPHHPLLNDITISLGEHECIGFDFCMSKLQHMRHQTSVHVHDLIF